MLLVQGLLLAGAAQAGTSPAAEEPFPPAAFPESFPRIRGERGLWFGPLQVCRERVARAELVVDHGSPALLLTFAPELRERLIEATRPMVDRQMTIRIDGRTVAAPTIFEPIAGGEAMIHGPAGKVLKKIGRRALRPCRGQLS